MTCFFFSTFFFPLYINSKSASRLTDLSMGARPYRRKFLPRRQLLLIQVASYVNTRSKTYKQTFTSQSMAVNSISISGMLTPNHLRGQKVKPRWPPMERILDVSFSPLRGLVRQFQSFARL